MGHSSDHSTLIQILLLTQVSEREVLIPARVLEDPFSPDDEQKKLRGLWILILLD